MASAFTHGFVGLALATAAAGVPPPRRLAVLAAGCAILPDADAVGFLVGIPYRSLLGHRGLSHSLAFAAVTGVVVTALAYRDLGAGSAAWWRRALLLGTATASHGVLDALTNGGLGVAFFSPFVQKRYFLPWRPVAVSPVNVGSFFSAWGLRILASEIRWVWIPATALMLIALVVRRGTAAAR